MAHVVTNSQFGQSLIARYHAILDRYHAARKLRADYDRTVAELEVLSDRDLRDLGLGRFEIHRTARKHVYGA